MTSGWGWRRRGGWRTGRFTRPARPLGSSVPWITVGLLVLLFHFLGGSLTSAEGVLFDLPESGLAEGAKTELVALALSMPRGTLVYFDDARYRPDDGASAAAFGEHLGERVRASGETTLMILADRAVAAGELMNLAAIARMSGVKRVLFANKRAEGRTE